MKKRTIESLLSICIALPIFIKYLVLLVVNIKYFTRYGFFELLIITAFFIAITMCIAVLSFVIGFFIPSFWRKEQNPLYNLRVFGIIVCVGVFVCLMGGWIEWICEQWITVFIVFAASIAVSPMIVSIIDRSWVVRFSVISTFVTFFGLIFFLTRNLKGESLFLGNLIIGSIGGLIAALISIPFAIHERKLWNIAHKQFEEEVGKTEGFVVSEMANWRLNYLVINDKSDVVLEDQVGGKL